MVCYLLQGRLFRWSNKDPVSFQQWKLSYLNQSSLFFRRGIIFSKYCSKHNFISTHNTDVITNLSGISANATAKCAVLLLMNMADSAWITVDCDKQVFSKIICYLEEQIDAKGNENTELEMIFDQSCVIKNQTCYLFKWIEDKPNDIVTIGKNININKLFEYLFHAISVVFPPIISPDFREKLMYSKHGNILNYYWTPIDDSGFEGIYISRDFSKLFQVGGNIFECGDNIFISIKFVCDGQIDCELNRSKDELGCLCSSTTNFSPNCVTSVDEHRKKCSFYHWETEKKCV